MLLIADGGSTKASWCLVDAEQTRHYFTTEGYNPEFIDTPGIIASLLRSLPDTLAREQVTELHFYGASISSPAKVAIVADALGSVFPQATLWVEHDLLAAARALLGHGAGFAAILGTGTNSCLYDGNQITANVDSLGYFLGDEGSGAYLGRRLLRDLLRQRMPEPLRSAFTATYGLGREQILDHLYHQPLPNRFLASFARFAFDHRHADYCREIVVEAFEDFFDHIVAGYPDFQRYPLNCVGSVGYNFRDLLAQVASTRGMPVGRIIRSPIDDLVSYHLTPVPATAEPAR
ncbi:N-acetylglucosamine kinase [Hymenobacter tenuis]